MPVSSFRFHAELNDFIPKEKQQADINVAFNGHETVKHLIESLGVPHTEVNVIFVDGISVNFSAQLEGGDRVDIYPGSQLVVCDSIIKLQPVYSGQMRFVLDGHLGKLAAYLRLLGFDTLYSNAFDDEELARITSSQDRILLTRDRGLLKRKLVIYGYYVRATSPQEQVVEVLQRFKIGDKFHLYSRCSLCNGSLISVTKEEVFDRLEPKTRLSYDDFSICLECDQIYWKGSHFKRMESQLQKYIELAISSE